MKATDFKSNHRAKQIAILDQAIKNIATNLQTRFILDGEVIYGLRHIGIEVSRSDVCEVLRSKGYTEHTQGTWYL
jgi:hypothetical protein